MSQSSEGRRRAASATSPARMFTPREKLPDLTMAMWAAAARTRASSSGVKPVDPITRATSPCSAARAARAAEAEPMVKSTITSQASNAASGVTRVRSARP